MDKYYIGVNGKAIISGKLTREYVKDQRDAILALFDYHFLSEKHAVGAIC